MSKVALERLAESFSEDILARHEEHGDETVTVKGAGLLRMMRFLRTDPVTRFEMLTDVTAVDYLGKREPRFEVVYHLYSLTKNHRLRLKVPVEEDESACEVASLVGEWKAACWMEREVFDLYGIRFSGHPDLRRILLYPEFEGYPLRKDYDLEHRQPRVPPREGRRHL